MTLADELTWRGFIKQTTFTSIDELDEPRTFYFGVDPSADGMTIGNLAPAMMIRHMINHGHKAILLVGGATGMIGDPDGKKQERDLKTLEQIAINKAAITKEYEMIFSGHTFEIVDNYDWFRAINFLDFLRDIGKHAPLTQMLDRDFVQSRIGEGGEGISYAEFSYSLIQGYDFLHLYRKKGATLQVAGADQWGNSISGVQLIRRIEGAETHVLTAPLVVNKQTGVKFGKSEGGAVWLDPKKTSPYKFYQFWLNTDDETAEDLIKIYTLLDRHTIEDVIAEHRQAPFKRLLQRTIAKEVTAMIHGRDRQESVEKVTSVLFGSAQFETLSEADRLELASEIPTAQFAHLKDILISTGLANGSGDAQRLLEAGSITLNGSKQHENVSVSQPALIKKGKNSFVLVH